MTTPEDARETPERRSPMPTPKQGLIQGHLGVLITAGVSFSAVVVSATQIWLARIDNTNQLEITRIQKEQELELKRMQLDAQVKSDFSQFVAENMDDLYSSDPDARARMRNLVLIAFPPSVSSGLFAKLQESVPEPQRDLWRESLRITDSLQGVNHFSGSEILELVQQAPVPVVVEFWAEWSAPNRQVEPIMIALAREFYPRAVFGRVNVDEEPTVAGRYGVRAIPTILVFKKGVVEATVTGARSIEHFREILEQRIP